MHSTLCITFPANAGDWGRPFSGGMPIEIHGSFISYETSLRVIIPMNLTNIAPIASVAIEKLGVTNCTRTFSCSRQVHIPTVRACNTFVSVNKFCKTRRHYWKPITHVNQINKNVTSFIVVKNSYLNIIVYFHNLSKQSISDREYCNIAMNAVYNSRNC